jgi:poly(3-hydroxybutyrate) depolymerase
MSRFLPHLVSGLVGAAVGISALKLFQWITTTEIPVEKQRGTFLRKLGNREYYIHVPESLDSIYCTEKKIPLLVCFHGVYSTAKRFCFEESNWRGLANHHHFIVVFPQAQGKVTNPWIGEDTHWHLHNDHEPFDGEDDLQFVKDLVDEISRVYSVDEYKIYAFGWNNGGVFVTNVALRYSKLFAAVCNFMGGISKDKMIDPATAQRKIPLYIISNQTNTTLEKCKNAEQVFQEHKFPVDFEILSGQGSNYNIEIEHRIWKWFLAHHYPY